jgi:phosphonate transport system ATP-binding protein
MTSCAASLASSSSSEESAPVLKIRDLTLSYPGRSAPVLGGFSLSVAAGERVAVVGPSGCGKTTLFRAVSGFVPVEPGHLFVDGVDVGSVRGRTLRHLRRRIAVIPQKHDLIDRLAVYQNVMAGALGRWSGLRALRFFLYPSRGELAEARAALERVSIAPELRRRTDELSGGQQQRVAIARALVQKPHLLLADEPVASLDPDLSHQILSLLCSLAASHGMALLCALHQPDLAERYFDRVLDLNGGDVVEMKPALLGPRSVAALS